MSLRVALEGGMEGVVSVVPRWEQYDDLSIAFGLVLPLPTFAMARRSDHETPYHPLKLMVTQDLLTSTAGPDRNETRRCHTE